MATNDKLGEHTPLAGLVLLDSNHQCQVTTTKQGKNGLPRSHSLPCCLATTPTTPRKTPLPSESAFCSLSVKPQRFIGEQPNLAPAVYLSIPKAWRLANRRIQSRCSQRCCSDHDDNVAHSRLIEHHDGALLDPSIKLCHHPCFPVGTTDLQTALYICYWCQ